MNLAVRTFAAGMLGLALVLLVMNGILALIRLVAGDDQILVFVIIGGLTIAVGAAHFVWTTCFPFIAKRIVPEFYPHWFPEEK